MTCMVKRRNLEPKKWSLFDIVRLYSSGVKMTLKVGLALMETAPDLFSNVELLRQNIVILNTS